MGVIWSVVLGVQILFVLVVMKRLSSARSRIPALVSLDPDLNRNKNVTIVIPTLNERLRLPACLEGLRSQNGVDEIIVVDSRSRDGTPEYVQEIQKDYPHKLTLLTDAELPKGWVGKQWALQTGFLNSAPTAEWILGIDADTIPQNGLVTSLVQTATAEKFDVVSLSPKFILQTIGEQWLQPALLVTLIFRFGAVGDSKQFSKERVMANGQCFLIRRSVLEKLQGYELAKFSFSDDVTLARAAAQRGAKVGFLDGSHLIKVRMYTSMAETWTEWGRSLDLKDSAKPIQTLFNFLVLLATQALPIPLLSSLTIWFMFFDFKSNIIINTLFWFNIFVVFLRFLLVIGIRKSYTDVGLAFWFSPFADPFAVLRILLSTLSRPQKWRGRIYLKT